jgi:hypothetical protein
MARKPALELGDALLELVNCALELVDDGFCHGRHAAGV